MLPADQVKALKVQLKDPFADQNEVIIFGTVAVEGAAPLSRADGSLATAKLDKWPFLELSAVFDQLIANDDRTQGNILLAPRGDLWLIDHARSLGGGGQRLFSSEILPLVKNFFLDRIAGFSLPERIKRKPTLIAACLSMSSVVPRIPYEGLLVPPDISVQIDHFLTQRGSHLQAMVIDAVGLPDMYDHGTQPRGAQ